MGKDSEFLVTCFGIIFAIGAVIWFIAVFVVVSRLNEFLKVAGKRHDEILQGIRAICDRLDLLKK